jgi:phage-related protein
MANTLGGSLTDMAAKITDLVVPGLGTLAETLIQFPQKLLTAITPFVEALNPALLLGFNQQLANLQATIGTAFQDIFSILAPVLDQAASLIQSTMTALRPVVDQVTQMFGDYMVEVARAFVSQMKILLPIIEVLANILQVFMTLTEMLQAPLRLVMEALGLLLKVGLMPLNLAMQALNAAMKPILALFDALSALGGAIMDVLGDLYTALFESLGLGDRLKSFARTVQDVTLMLFKAIVQFVNSLPFGWGSEILAAMLKRLEGTAHAIAAPKEVAFKGIEQITKDIAAGAFVAGAGTEKDEQLDVMKQMRDYLREIVEQNKGKPGVLEQAREAVGGFMDDHPEFTNTLGQAWLNVGLPLGPG